MLKARPAPWQVLPNVSLMPVRDIRQLSDFSKRRTWHPTHAPTQVRFFSHGCWIRGAFVGTSQHVRAGSHGASRDPQLRSSAARLSTGQTELSCNIHAVSPASDDDGLAGQLIIHRNQWVVRPGQAVLLALSCLYRAN